MVGVPGSGKSTYVRQFLSHALRLSLDDLRLMLSGRAFDARIEPAVAVAAEAIKEALASYAASQGRDIVFDATNVTRARRAALVATARRFGFSPVAVYLSTTLPLAHARNAGRPNPVPTDVLDRFGQRLEPPSLDEGFDEVIEVASDDGTFVVREIRRRAQAGGWG